MTLGSTQPLTEMSTRRISWGKGGRCIRLTTLPTLCAVVMKSRNLNFLEPSGPLQACNGSALPLPSQYKVSCHDLAASCHDLAAILPLANCLHQQHTVFILLLNI